MGWAPGARTCFAELGCPAGLVERLEVCRGTDDELLNLPLGHMLSGTTYGTKRHPNAAPLELHPKDWRLKPRFGGEAPAENAHFVELFRELAAR